MGSARVVDDKFWADSRQAQERLNGSYVLHDNKPFNIIEVRNDWDEAEGKDVIKAVGHYSGENTGRLKYLKLSDKKFEMFRKLPTLGWFNYQDTKGGGYAVYLRRVASRTRTHGLSQTNCYGYIFSAGGSLDVSKTLTAGHFLKSQSFADAHDGEQGYPSLEEILLAIRDNSAIAYSPRFCVYRCKDGVRWLFRKRSRVGMFSGMDTLTLFPKLGFYREEIMEDPRFTLNKIKEF